MVVRGLLVHARVRHGLQIRYRNRTRGEETPHPGECQDSESRGRTLCRQPMLGQCVEHRPNYPHPMGQKGRLPVVASAAPIHALELNGTSGTRYRAFPGSRLLIVNFGIPHKTSVGPSM